MTEKTGVMTDEELNEVIAWWNTKAFYDPVLLSDIKMKHTPDHDTAALAYVIIRARRAGIKLKDLL